ncbi:MAG: hypothetical protein AAF212_13040, partial [Verrucomicrobiota bacterium]
MIDERYVEIFNLVKAYPNPFGDEIKVVDGFELKVPRGDVVSIIGHSGCGFRASRAFWIFGIGGAHKSFA